ncbi:SdrD B-like domain-containing protein [Actinocrispum sp. NPDC049592]|uniref:SdrD B-like domain-containing protein n=1 Tax=Actinocrispum sp. NPDC049592 TaxID=3154835 RepID=UPI003448B08B
MASADQGGSICGTVWHDVNEDGVRDANEPVIPNHLVGLHGNGDIYVNSGDDGRYCFTNIAEGDYTLRSNDRSLLDQTSWTHPGRDSKFDEYGAGYAAGDPNQGPIHVTEKTRIDDYDSGFLDARVDLHAVQIIVTKQNPQVGDVFEIYGSVGNSGNAPEQLNGTLTLPEGLTILDRAGGMPSYVQGQQVIGNFYERRFAGDVEFVGATVRVDKPVNGEIKIETFRGVFPDVNPGNNVLTQPISIG